jgi:DNA-binding transcriptional LysR family regulator
MDRFSEMMVFVRVVENGSFSSAGRTLSLTPSAISKLITRLEERLGARLFHRSSRTVALTSEGEAYYAGAQRALEAVEEAEAVSIGSGSPAGMLRIRAAPAFARYQLAPLMPVFRLRYPQIYIEFLLGNDSIGLLDGNVDLAIKSGELTDSSLIARRIASTRWIICASPEYLATHGTPRSLADLSAHECLNFTMSTPWNTWTTWVDEDRQNRIKIKGHIAANQGDMLLALARAGTGIVCLAEFHISEDLATNRLVPLFPEHQDQTEEPIYAIYQNRRHLSQRVRVFLNFLEESFSRGGPPWRRPVC